MKLERMLAKIQLDGNEGTGYLFWKDGSIWCEREATGKQWNTETRCNESDAIETIRLTWGQSNTWLLEFIRPTILRETENGAVLWKIETDTTTYYQIEGENGELMEPMDDGTTEDEAIAEFES